MTEETQALVDRLLKRADMVDEWARAIATKQRPAHANAHGVTAALLRDAAAALSSLSRDLETARQERDAARASISEANIGWRNAGVIAVREARAETWATAGEELRQQAGDCTNATVRRSFLLAADFCTGMGKATAAREGQ